jgi:hypothetical protein
MPEVYDLVQATNLIQFEGSLREVDHSRLRFDYRYGVEKIISNLRPACAEDCGDLKRVLKLNAVFSVLSSKDSLTIILKSVLVPKAPFVALLDCGSSDCFIKSNFVHKYCWTYWTVSFHSLPSMYMNEVA